MRVAVLQFAVGEYTKMLEVSRQRHIDGCKRFGYSYRCDFALRAKHPYWHKLEMVLEAIRDGFDYVVWIDADTIWNGFDPLTDAIKTDGIGMTWADGVWPEPYYQHYNCGVYFIRCVDNKDEMIATLTKWQNEPDDGHPWGDQHAFHKLLGRNEIEVTRVDDRFNNGFGNPVIRAWHGQGIKALPDMIRYERRLHNGNQEFIGSRMLKYADFKEDWFRSAAEELGQEIWPHRKFWEYIYIAVVLKQRKKIFQGSKGIVFGSGKEWLPSYLAGQGCFVTITDKQESGEWAKTNQHGSSKWDCFRPDMVDKETFDRLVTFEAVDMNMIPSNLKQAEYDFVWSSSSLEHIGSRHLGRLFMWNAMECLKRNGVAVHTTEGCLSGGTYDSLGFSVFGKEDFDHMVDVQSCYSSKMSPVAWGTDVAQDIEGMYDSDNARKWTSVGLVIDKA